MDGRHGEKQIPRTYLRFRSGSRQERTLQEDDKEACQTREYCLAKNARHRHPITPKAGMMGTPVRAPRLGPSLAQKWRSFRMTRDKGLWRARVKVMPFQIVSCAVEPFPSRDCPPEQPAGCCRAALGLGGLDDRPHTDAGTLARPHTSSFGRTRVVRPYTNIRRVARGARGVSIPCWPGTYVPGYRYSAPGRGWGGEGISLPEG